MPKCKGASRFSGVKGVDWAVSKRAARKEPVARKKLWQPGLWPWHPVSLVEKRSSKLLLRSPASLLLRRILLSLVRPLQPGWPLLHQPTWILTTQSRFLMRSGRKSSPERRRNRRGERRMPSEKQQPNLFQPGESSSVLLQPTNTDWRSWGQRRF